MSIMSNREERDLMATDPYICDSCREAIVATLPGYYNDHECDESETCECPYR